MTYPAEHYVQHADELAQEVVNVWGQYAFIGHQDALSSEFMALFENAHRYRQAKREASNHRQLNLLTAEEDAEEEESRRLFAETYQSLHDAQAASEK